MTDEKKSTATEGMSKLIGETMLEKELASALGVPLATVKRLRHEGNIPYVQIGGAGRVIYLVESVLAWLRQKEVREQDART